MTKSGDVDHDVLPPGSAGASSFSQFTDVQPGFEDEPDRRPRAVAGIPDGLAFMLGLLFPVVVAGLAALGEHLAWAVENTLRISFLSGALLAVLFFSPRFVGKLSRRPATLPHPIAFFGLLGGLILATVPLTGGPLSPVLMLFHALAVAAGAVLRPRLLSAATPVWGLCLVGLLLGTGAPVGWSVVHALMFLGFVSLARALLAGAIRAARLREQSRVDEEILRWYEDARDFRLFGQTSELSIAPAEGAADQGRQSDAEVNQARGLFAATQTVREGVYRTLLLGARMIKPDCVALYVFTDDGKKLRLKEQHLEVDDNCAKEVDATEGGIGLCLKKNTAVQLKGVGAHPHLVTHRKGQPVVQHLLCVPVHRQGLAVGVLVVDRATGQSFDRTEEGIAGALARELVTLVDTERVISALDRERQKKTRIFAAARAFGGVVRKEDAVAVTLDTALAVAPLKVAAFVDIVDAVPLPGLTVPAARGDDAERLAEKSGTCTDDNWVGRALGQGTILPHVPLSEVGVERGLLAEDDGLSSGYGDLRVLPLFAQGQAMGALVVATEKDLTLTRAHMDALAVVADLAGVAITGTQHYETVLEQATTDPLTGLKNRRTMEKAIDEALARVKRQSRPISLILSDIDHFKSVNDTYGHQVGDRVLQAVAGKLMECARTTDVVARFGGEEFCMLLEDTDRAGAARLAERIRKEVKALTFETELGVLSVSISLGIGEFFVHGDHLDPVVKAADDALYMAKQQGRNRVIICPEPQPAASA
jgi:diguanylate cyclase (GGDEF)-like protein